ncbi:P-II family nitrogen regulator [Thermosulfuriphilus ammonigenes]|uniref:P-II family nitrogen regulator n=1 Tax=Thermosulfuriphilus ammonigenes TaxID=1936021 RepID=A0A6G7PV09_9BACT|nr:P-II family nitrogen regulator [Thermosulfuriphilus ammonigenes]MBA2848598.1 nitrogen regulatory protein P-II 1 [Thermosulfuriphilus ammonigenes]QIJ71263.1 P-II family nitrogen regulator [Thermosulfuriphilus ammonigenes]
MKEIRAIIRPEKLHDVLEALDKVGHPGVTVTRIEGHGRQAGLVEQFRGREYRVELLPKVKLEIVCQEEEVESLTRTIAEAARTGEIGDGKIFVYDVLDAMRIRSGEKGKEAV